MGSMTYSLVECLFEPMPHTEIGDAIVCMGTVGSWLCRKAQLIRVTEHLVSRQTAFKGISGASLTSAVM